MQGYIGKPGLVFRTDLRIVNQEGKFKLRPEIVAEPGDVILVSPEGTLLANLTRAMFHIPRIQHNLRSLRFVKAIAS